MTHGLGVAPVATPAACGSKVELATEVLRNDKRPHTAKETLRRNKVGGIALPDSKPHCKATVIRTVGFWQFHFLSRSPDTVC